MILMEMSKQEIGYLRIIADDVKNYLKNPTAIKPEKSSIGKTIVMILPKVTPGMKFKVIWHYSNEPFIMAIRPDINELESKAKDLVDILQDPKRSSQDYLNKWCEIKTWEIWIDPRVLTKNHPCCVDDGNQFVGILCHELGHAMNADPIAMVRSYRDSMVTMTRVERMMMSDNPIIRTLILPMFVATMTFRIVIRGNRDTEKLEMAADAYVPSQFRGDLVTYIENHILTVPETVSSVVITDNEYSDQQKIAVQYSKSTIELMERRRDVLKRQINAQYHSPDSDGYIKAMMKKLGSMIGSYDPNLNKSALLSENAQARRYMSNLNHTMESANMILESINVTDRDLTILEIEASDIKTTEDKLYIIQTIYDYLEAISKQQSDKIKKLQKNGSSKAEIDQIIKRDTRVTKLTELRTRVMAMQVDEHPDHYGVFIRYPKGYEG